ncbi:MAG: imidazole glycerol phosphate synthase subunit HisH [Clostridia bacterium]|nr:imidazole glycerol phosphate synthase subunit HisH [Clostridia bacterium]
MTAIVDYGVGNLFSLESSLNAIGERVRVTPEAQDIMKADRVILPGVGAFGDAAKKLRDSGLDQAVLQAAEAEKPVMGICLGMQLLFEKSFEYGEHPGLGLLHGEVRPIRELLEAAGADPEKKLKIPQMGWNALRFRKESSLFRYIEEGDHVYFVHSYAAAGCEDSLLADTEYGTFLTACVGKGNVFGCQFHPEKSGNVGLKILKAFCEMGRADA